MKIIRNTLIFALIILCTNNSYSQKLKVKEKKGKYGFSLNKKNTSGYIYDEVNKKYKNSYEVRKGNKWGIVNNRGVETVPCKYDTLLPSWSKDIIAVLDGKYGVINTEDSTIVNFDYQEIDYYIKSTGLVKINNKWGVLENGEIDFSPGKIIFRTPEKMPLFQSCKNFREEFKSEKDCADRKLLQYVYQNIKYPQEAVDFKVEGTIVISFVISKEGNVINPKIIRDIGANCGQAGMEVVNKMDKWVPGFQDGQPVATQFNLPIKFSLK